MGTFTNRGTVIAIAGAGVAIAGISGVAAQAAVAGSAPSGGAAAAGVTSNAKAKAFLVQAEAAAGAAAVGNSQPADFLVVVTDPATGAPIVNLAQSNFVVINHFSHPGQACGFSNNIVAFGNVGTGAYHVQVALQGCTWARGDSLAQIMVTSGSRRGQAVATLEIP